jgi:hypothetical protein
LGTIILTQRQKGEDSGGDEQRRAANQGGGLRR